MPSPSFSDQTVLVVGLAREGTVAARWLAERGARVLASDVRDADALAPALAALTPLGVEAVLGAQTLDLLHGIDLIVASPGVPQDIPLLVAARAQGLPITTETRLFAERCPAPLLGITGSSGKTTTATLCAHILEAAGFSVRLGGNIGTPLLGDLAGIAPTERVVMELSSFQLLYWGKDVPSGRAGISPPIAALLNVTPNHLDRHPSMAHYTAAKAQILAHQSPQDTVVLSRDDPVTAAWARAGRARVPAGEGQEAVDFPLAARTLTFGLGPEAPAAGSWLAEDGQVWLRWQGEDHPILPARDIQLRGRHNLSNVLAAVCLAAAAGAAPAAMAGAISHFQGVAHRLEIVARRGEVLWVNDSIATSPERALAALHSFEQPLILLAGGRDKHLPWTDWAAAVHQRARHVITFGEAAGLIDHVLSPTPPGSHVQSVEAGGDLAGAVALAAARARAGDVVLLSPGGTSFDAYRDFAARGEHFRALVHDLAPA